MARIPKAKRLPETAQPSMATPVLEKVEAVESTKGEAADKIAEGLLGGTRAEKFAPMVSVGLGMIAPGPKSAASADKVADVYKGLKQGQKLLRVERISNDQLGKIQKAFPGVKVMITGKK